jgi:quercetin dioxygenase-like cupin family protein
MAVHHEGNDRGATMSHLEDIGGVAPLPIWDGVAARVVAGEGVSLAVIELDPGALVPEHRHPNEQLGVVIEGTVDWRIGEETRTLGPGGTWQIPGDMPHEVRAGDEGAVVVDVFAPVRADWGRFEPEPPRAPRWP